MRSLRIQDIATGKKHQQGLQKHEKSNFHKEAVLKLMPSMRPNDELMYSAIVKSKQENKAIIMKLLQNIEFLARQGLPLRGDQGQGNFDQLILLRAEDDPSLLEWIRKKADKFTSPETQNEILKIILLTLLRTIEAGIHESPYFTVMIDEMTDITNKEQCTVCIRWVDKNLEVFEDFIGFWQVSSIDANTLVSVIPDVLLRMNLSINKC